MSTPRIKRPFAGAASDPSQRQITSFFNTRSPHDVLSNPEPIRSPPLPSSVQSNLLTVGMRIRKSVPEGYKTYGTSAFKLWTDPSSPATTATVSSTIKTSSRELLPFCGINRVGGMDVQPDFRLDDDYDDVPGLDAVPELTLSQESTDSTISNENTRKRFFDEDERLDPVRAWIEPKASWDGDVSPRSLAPIGWGNARVMAVPRSRVKRNSPLKEVDQENMAVDSDFEDAEFLVYEQSSEVEMSG